MKTVPDERIKRLAEIEKRIGEIAALVASDYPGISECNSWEQLWAIEQSYLGTNSAIQDWLDLTRELASRLGLSDEQCADISTGLRLKKEGKP